MVEIPNHAEGATELKYFWKARRIISDLLPTLEQNYGKKYVDKALSNDKCTSLARLMEYVEGQGLSLDDARTVKVLCLGCGNTGPFRGTEAGRIYDALHSLPGAWTWRWHRFKPWFPRILHQLGFQVTAVDIGSLNDEPYEHHSGIDLCNPVSFNGFPDHSFQAIEMNALTDIIEPAIPASPQENNAHTIHLLQAINRILTPNGIFLHERAADETMLHFKQNSSVEIDIAPQRAQVEDLLTALFHRQARTIKPI